MSLIDDDDAYEFDVPETEDVAWESREEWEASEPTVNPATGEFYATYEEYVESTKEQLEDIGLGWDGEPLDGYDS